MVQQKEKKEENLVRKGSLQTDILVTRLILLRGYNLDSAVPQVRQGFKVWDLGMELVGAPAVPSPSCQTSNGEASLRFVSQQVARAKDYKLDLGGRMVPRAEWAALGTQVAKGEVRLGS